MGIDIYKNSEKLINIMNHFWKRWSTEYETNLRDYHNSFNAKVAII